MLDEAITLIQKQIDTYKIMDKNICSHSRRKAEENKIKARIRKEIQLRDYILKILKERKI